LKTPIGCGDVVAVLRLPMWSDFVGGSGLTLHA